MITEHKHNKAYINSFSYQTDSSLSKIIKDTRKRLPIEKCNVWEYNPEDDSWTIRDENYELNDNCQYYVSYDLMQLFNFIREDLQIHINIFIDGGWTYSIEDFGNNKLPILTDFCYDTYQEALQQACKDIFNYHLTDYNENKN